MSCVVEQIGVPIENQEDWIGFSLHFWREIVCECLRSFSGESKEKLHWMALETLACKHDPLLNVVFHFSIPLVFQLIQWNKTTHLLLTLGSHNRFHKGKASLETWPSFLALASDDSCAARLEINELAMVRQGWTLESCELQLPYHGMPWKCTINKPHQRHWTRQRVTMPGVSDIFKKLKRMYKWKPDVNSRMGLSTGLVSQMNPTLASASFSPRKSYLEDKLGQHLEIQRAMVGPSGLSVLWGSKCTLNHGLIVTLDDFGAFAEFRKKTSLLPQKCGFEWSWSGFLKTTTRIHI